jgi:hypothetical protein
LQTSTRRNLFRSGSFAVAGLALGVLFLWLSAGQPKAPQVLRFDRARTFRRGLGVDAARSNIVDDDLRQKYDPKSRVQFHVTCTQDTSIFVLETGVQVHSLSGWQTFLEDYRGEIWRLKSGMPREVCVERPQAGMWRAYIRYGTQMRGTSLLKAQLREAWLTRSFSNWTGKAWGGGRWSGTHELFSDPVTE